MTNSDMITETTPAMREMLTRLATAVDTMIEHCHPTAADWIAAQRDAQFFDAATIELHTRQAETIAARLAA